MSAAPPLHVEAHGSGPPIVLIHGFGATLYTWRFVAPVLVRDHRVIAVDLKGAGRAPKPRDGHYSVLDQARHVAELVAERDLHGLTLVGHSFGGGVALAALALGLVSPDRVAGLVLIDSMAYRQSLPWFISLLRTPVLGTLGPALVPAQCQVRLVLRAAYHRPERITADAVRAYAAPLREPAARRALAATAAALPPAEADDLALRYPELRVPTLLLWGRHDRIVPLGIGERLHAAIPASRLVVVEDAGHLPHEERPEPVLHELGRFVA